MSEWEDDRTYVVHEPTEEARAVLQIWQDLHASLNAATEEPLAVDWPARLRDAAKVADGPWISDPAGALYAAAHVLEQTPPHVVEAIGRALSGEGEQ